MHIVSSVEGKLSGGKTPYDLMRATLPAGTVSGAPKLRAMQIIADLEGTTRGPYGGCVGYFSFNGNLDTCITIRTALLKDGKAYVQAGGGWVTDSEPEAEFQETVNKSRRCVFAFSPRSSPGQWPPSPTPAGEGPGRRRRRFQKLRSSRGNEAQTHGLKSR